MIDIKELGYIVIGTQHLKKWECFGVELLGMMAEYLDEDTLCLRIDHRACRFLIKRSASESLISLGWLLQDRSAFEVAKNKLSIDGRATFFGSEHECMERRIIEFCGTIDPVGVRHEFGWGPQINYKQRFISQGNISGFVTGKEGLGHAVFGCPQGKFDHVVEFVCQVLNFKLSNLRYKSIDNEKEIIPIHWYNCHNGRHHTFAVANANTKHNLHHIMLQCLSIDDVGRVYNSVEDKGFRLASTLGRHPNDGIVSFYIETPSGFWMEIGCELYSRDELESITFCDSGNGSVWGHKYLLPFV